jgi:ABC-type glycerol-3-phosphate transport system permease component
LDFYFSKRYPVKRILPDFEHRAQPVLSRQKFIRRLANSGLLALGVIAFSLLIGMLGYRILEDLSWMDAFLNAAMLLGGMGPVNAPASPGGKLFAGLYALYCGLVVILVAGILLAPVAHRILHKFHVEGRGS